MKPNILTIDIETSPIIARVWGLWDNNVALNQIVEDWKIISFAAKWLDDPKVVQMDTEKHTEKVLVKALRALLDTADIVIGQNSKKFDIKKINAKIHEYGLKPPSSFQQIDIMQLAKKNFAFTSNKLEYVTKKFNKKYTKQTHGKFPGQELWNECLAGNKAAWKEMRKYNIYDVLATEERYKGIAPWGTGINFNAYYGDEDAVCSCGCKEFQKNGYAYTANGKYQRYYCKDCWAELRSRQNLNKNKLTPTKR